MLAQFVFSSISLTNSGRPCAPSALQATTTPTPEFGRYRRNACVDSSAPFIPTMGFPFHSDTPQPSPKTVLVPSDVGFAVHIIFTVSDLRTLPVPTAITKRIRPSAEESKPPAG